MIEVSFCGPLNTIQDRGRFLHRHDGVSTAGPMDHYSHRLALALAGASVGDACIEVQTFPFEARIQKATKFAVVGATCRVELDHRKLLSSVSAKATAGAMLRIGAPIVGARVYLAFAGGMDVPVVLGSRATDLRAGFGGFRGRALKAGDLVQLGQSVQETDADDMFAVSIDALQGILDQSAIGAGPHAEIRLLPAAEFKLLDAVQRRLLLEQDWKITSQSNRTGFRLSASEPILGRLPDLPSHGLVNGVVQLPRDGWPIIQLADAKTAGGYPKIGCVIDSDLPKIGQIPIGGTLRFKLVSIQNAISAEVKLHEHAEAVLRDAAACAEKLWPLGD